ncbi:AraC family transcriptional regulator [Bacterioplanoides sp.]|uniref:AraC family transcriptional regulator n=1 Tax=Bacterioplanoides sp. TaxID=2066072 RepID=UPI003B0094F5
MSSSLFWRHNGLPYAELRRVNDGRKVNYAPHSHPQWSIGAITEGRCTFQYRQDHYPISSGDLVMMNPQWVHSCNPVEDHPWAYWMMYIDTHWLMQLLQDAGLSADNVWQPINRAVIPPQDHTTNWYQDYCEMAAVFSDNTSPLLAKQSLLIDFLLSLMGWLRNTTTQIVLPPRALEAVAQRLTDNLSETPTLAELQAIADCSEGHLIRSFKSHYGLTPHAYLINQRIQYSQQLLKQGQGIADIAQQLAFSDQAHFQRAFKKLTATTPGQYLKNAL